MKHSGNISEIFQITLSRSFFFYFNILNIREKNFFPKLNLICYGSLYGHLKKDKVYNESVIGFECTP